MPDRPFARLARLPLRDQAYATLLDAIVSGELAPGSRLRDQELAAEFGVSRTPIREALRRLEDEGLVQSVPGALTRVTPLDITDAREAVPVVAALHAVATREAVPRLTPDDLAALRAANASFAAALADDIRAALAADDAFHELFIRVAANGELQRSLDRLMPRVRRLELARFRSLTGRASVEHHEAIIAAAARGDAIAAAAQAEANWLSLGRLLAETFHNDDPCSTAES
jgi:DNA-binding GntR family transcriptional regulator